MHLPDSPTLPAVTLPEPDWRDLLAPLGVPSATQWSARLCEYLPEAYVRVNACALNELHKQGASPHCAAIYALAYGLPARAPATL